MRTELGLLFKQVNKGAEKVNDVSYFNRPPPPSEKYFNEEDAYAVYDQTGFSFLQITKDPTWIIGAKVKEFKVKTMEITIDGVNMSEIGATIATTTIGIAIAIEMIRLDLMFLLKIGNLVRGDLEVICHVLSM